MRICPIRLAATLCVVVCCGLGTLQAREYEVSCRLLNGKTGKPIPNALAMLSLVFDPPGPRGLGTEFVGWQKTNAEGVAKFTISDPLPRRLAIGFGGDPHDLLSCSQGPPPLPTSEVLESGFVTKNLCDKKGRLKDKVEAKPGEVVGFAEPPSWWRRLIPTQ